MAVRGEFVVVRQGRKVGSPDKKQSEEEEEEEGGGGKGTFTPIINLHRSRDMGVSSRGRATESSSFGLSLACKGHQICRVAEIQHNMV